MGAVHKPLHGVGFDIRHADLRRSFSLQRVWGDNKSIIIRLEPNILTFLYEKGGVKCEVGCPISSAQAMKADDSWLLETDVSLFRKFLCNETYWSVFLAGHNLLAQFRANLKSPVIDRDDADDALFYIECGSMSLNWPVSLRSVDDHRLETGLGAHFNPRAVGDTLETALPFADRRGDERYRAIEYTGNTALAASTAGARVVEGDISTDIAIRVDRAYATGLCSLFRHMDGTAQAWRVGSTQHFADDRVHVSINETAHTLPSFSGILNAVPLFRTSVGLFELASDIQRILQQCVAKPSRLRLTVNVERVLSLSTPVRGGIAKLVFAKKLDVLTATEGAYEAEIDGDALELLVTGLPINESAAFSLHVQGIVMISKIDNVVVKTVIPFVNKLNLTATDVGENSGPEKARAKWGAHSRSQG